MKEMSKNPQAAEKARRAERARDKEAGLVKLDMTAKPASGGGFKKGGFKSAFGAVGGGGEAKKDEVSAPTPVVVAAAAPATAKGGFKKVFAEKAEEVEGVRVVEKAVVGGGGGGGGEVVLGDGDDSEEETDSDADLGYEKYNPLRPTGCGDVGCKCREDVIPQTLFPA